MNVSFQFVEKLSESENQNLYLIADISNGGKQMFLQFQKVRTKYFYTIGYCSEWKKYLLAITVTYVGWYEQYYIIQKDEYDLWKDNIDQLDAIVEECRKNNIHSKRFLYSEMPQENTTKEQLEFSFSEIAMSKGNTDFEEI